MKYVPSKVPAYQQLPTETSTTKDFSCLNHTQKNEFKNKIVIFFFQKNGIFSFSKKKVIQYRYFFFHSSEKKYDIFTHSPILGEFLQKQSSTWGKKIRPF